MYKPSLSTLLIGLLSVSPLCFGAPGDIPVSVPPVDSSQMRQLEKAPIDEQVLPQPLGALRVENKAAKLKSGCATRKRMAGLVRVYEICGYSYDGSLEGWQERILAESSPKTGFVLKLDFLYSVGGKRAAKSFSKALLAFPLEQKEANQEQKAFLSWIESQPMDRGSVLELHFNSDESLSAFVFNKDQSDSFKVKSKLLASNFASIWLSQNGIDSQIRDKLLKEAP